MTVKELAKMTGIDPWFLYQLKEITDMSCELEKHADGSVPDAVLREAKRMGFSDRRAGGAWRCRTAKGVRKRCATAQEARADAGLQARGHLRRGV